MPGEADEVIQDVLPRTVVTRRLRWHCGGIGANLGTVFDRAGWMSEIEGGGEPALEPGILGALVVVWHGNPPRTRRERPLGADLRSDVRGNLLADGSPPPSLPRIRQPDRHRPGDLDGHRPDSHRQSHARPHAREDRCPGGHDRHAQLDQGACGRGRGLYPRPGTGKARPARHPGAAGWKFHLAFSRRLDTLDRRERRWVWAFGTRRHHEAEREIKLRIGNVLLSDDIPNPRDVALIGLAVASDLLGDTFPERNIEQRKMDLIGRELAGAISDIEHNVKMALSGAPPSKKTDTPWIRQCRRGIRRSSLAPWGCHARHDAQVLGAPVGPVPGTYPRADTNELSPWWTHRSELRD